MNIQQLNRIYKIIFQGDDLIIIEWKMLEDDIFLSLSDGIDLSPLDQVEILSFMM